MVLQEHVWIAVCHCVLVLASQLMLSCSVRKVTLCMLMNDQLCVWCMCGRLHNHYLRDHHSLSKWHGPRVSQFSWYTVNGMVVMDRSKCFQGRGKKWPLMPRKMSLWWPILWTSPSLEFDQQGHALHEIILLLFPSS